MEQKLVFDLSPMPGNGRNSEGSFLRAPDGRILFAYSHYTTDNGFDDASCDIWMISSADEGQTWGNPRCIAKASDFGVENIMSVSGVPLRDGRLCFFFMIKENDPIGSASVGRAVSDDGGNTFTVSRCRMRMQRNFYLFNNDRIIRMRDGRLLVPSAVHTFNENCDGTPFTGCDLRAEAVCLTSDDEGESFRLMPAKTTVLGKINRSCGLQEPGVLENGDSLLWFWARTNLHCQYEWYSVDGMNSFTQPEPSEFTSPCSPMSVKDGPDGYRYAVYNPVPGYNGIPNQRNPLVLRKSADRGLTWGPLNTVENDPSRGFCYTAMFFTADNCLLLGYCRGQFGPDRGCLNRLGIMKVRLDSVE